MINDKVASMPGTVLMSFEIITKIIPVFHINREDKFVSALSLAAIRYIRQL
jgi:hypothetical protein